jgi:hypothetical protein
MINVTDRAHVAVRLIALKFFLCHFFFLRGQSPGLKSRLSGTAEAVP